MIKEIFCFMENGFDRTTACCFGMADDIDNTCWGRGIRNEYIIHFVVVGKGYVNGREVRQNQGFVLKPGKLYEYHADEKEPWQYFWIDLNGQNAPTIMKQYDFPFDTEFFHFCFHNNFTAAYKSLFDSPSITVSQNFFTGLLHMMLSFVQEDNKSSPITRSQSHVEHAMSILQNSYYSKIKISDVADRLFLDPGYLYNLFMKYVGISPKEYLNNIRIQKACELLSKTDYLISEISCSVGYDDPLQFSKFFKSRTGKSPLDYRSLAQKKNIVP